MSTEKRLFGARKRGGPSSLRTQTLIRSSLRVALAGDSEARSGWFRFFLSRSDRLPSRLGRSFGGSDCGSWLKWIASNAAKWSWSENACILLKEVKRLSAVGSWLPPPFPQRRCPSVTGLSLHYWKKNFRLSVSTLMHDISCKFAASSIIACSFFTKTNEIQGYKTRSSSSIQPGNFII